MIVHNNINLQEALYGCTRMHVFGVLYTAEVYSKLKCSTTFNATRVLYSVSLEYRL